MVDPEYEKKMAMQNTNEFGVQIHMLLMARVRVTLRATVR